MKIKNYRWLIVALLFIVTVINYIDRQVIGLLKPILEEEFHWSETDFSHIVMAFTAAYALGLLLFGKFIDKVGTKIGYTVCVVIWSVAGMLHAVAKSVTGFCLARVGLGVGEAGNFPAAMKVVSEWFPPKERALATGIFNSGTSVGVVVALFIVPWILSHYGWHGVFWITGGLGFAWLLFWFLLYELPAKQKRLTEKEFEYIQFGGKNECDTTAMGDAAVTERKTVVGKKYVKTEPLGKDTAPTEKIKWIKLFSMPQTWAFITGKLFIDPIFWFFLFWLPSYFSSAFHLDLTKPSLELMIVYAATTVGSIAGGYFSSWLIKRGYSAVKARKTALLIFAFLEVSIILVQFASDMWVAVALLSVAVAVHQAWATNVFTFASDLFPPNVLSSVVGIGGMAGATGGILFPMLVGALLDYYKVLGNLTIGYHILFTICGFTYLFAWVIIHLLTRQKNENPKNI